MARELRFDIAWGRCSSAEMPSYWPWTQVLNTLLGTAELLEPGRFASRPELFAAVAEAIEARTRVQAVLVIFEDAHWADPGSLGLLEFLAGMVGRPAVAAPDHIQGRLRDARRYRRRTADPVVRSRPRGDLGSRPADRRCGTEPEYLAEVHRRSGGNPFFATEVARLQASRGTADRGGSGGGATGARAPARPAAPGVRRPAAGGQRGGCAGCGPPGQRHRAGRGRGRGAARRTGRCRCRGGRCVRARPDARDAVSGDEPGPSSHAAPPGGRAPAGRGSGRAGQALVPGVGSRRPAACCPARRRRRRPGGGRAGPRAGGRLTTAWRSSWASGI